MDLIYLPRKKHKKRFDFAENEAIVKVAQDEKAQKQKQTARRPGRAETETDRDRNNIKRTRQRATEKRAAGQTKTETTKNRNHKKPTAQKQPPKKNETEKTRKQTMTKLEKAILFKAITTKPERFEEFYTEVLFLEATKHLTKKENEDEELLAWVTQEAREIAGAEKYFYTQTDEGREYTETEEDFCNSLTPKRDGRTIAKWGKSDTKYFRKHTAPDGTII